MFFGGAFKSRFSINRNKVNRPVVEAVPHVQRAVGLGRRHAKPGVVRSKIRQHVTSLLRNETIGRVALGLVVA